MQVLSALRGAIVRGPCRRGGALAALLLVTACASPEPVSGPAPPAAAPPPATEVPPGACQAAAAQSGVGQAYTEALSAQLQAAAGAKTVRVIRPGQAVTMDYRDDRLNLELDAAGKITRVFCG